MANRKTPLLDIMPRDLLEKGYALHRQGKLADAERLYVRLLETQPDNVDALHSLGILAVQSGRPQHGAALIGRAVAIAPHFAQAHVSLGSALLTLGQLAEALASFNRAITLDPRNANAHYNRALALLRLDRAAEALAGFDHAVALNPGHAEAYLNRGSVLIDLGRAADAVLAFDRAIALRPNFAEAWCNRGLAQRMLKRFDDALASYERAVGLNPGSAQVHYNRGNTLSDLKRWEEAVASFDRAIALEPASCETHVNRAQALTELKRLDEALAGYDRAIALNPGMAVPYLNKSQVLLLSGRFGEGWPLYEYRKKLVEPILSEAPAATPWLGDLDIRGKTLLVESERGLGDIIQFARYAHLAQDLGAKVVLATPGRLVRLMEGLIPSIEIVGADALSASCDFRIALLSMPLAFKNDADTIPGRVPYLRAEPELVRKWRTRIGHRGFKIGICWQGSRLAGAMDRSFSVAEFRNIARIPNLRLISLQKGGGTEQLRDLPAGMAVETLGEDFDSGPDAFIDTAAVMDSLDLVITADTAIAHLAGALGQPCWVALKHVPDWRWLLDRSDSPWYPTLTLFRQPVDGNWAGLFAEVEARLAEIISETQKG
ncbi:MAG TPA: tetratricopeptide repeat protein [Rhizomicrobium sp.]|nr:tetratricopeptide repeat protein [Rhizomicrobium sp.]